MPLTVYVQYTSVTLTRWLICLAIKTCENGFTSDYLQEAQKNLKLALECELHDDPDLQGKI